MSQAQTYVIAQAPSLERLVAFEQVSWRPQHQASKADLAQRRQAYPEGFFLLSDGEQDVCQITIFPKDVPSLEAIKSFEQMLALPVVSGGKHYWVANVATREGSRGKGYAGTLLSAVIAWVKSRGGETITTGVTCYGLAEALEQGRISSPEEYIEKDMNPGLRVVKKAAGENGCTVCHTALIKHYWDDDVDSSGYGLKALIRLR
jgi:GNAT superfamily N-acetyltransferase